MFYIHFLVINDLQKLDQSLALSTEQITEIFQVIDHDQDNMVTSDEVDQLLNTILPYYQEAEMNNNRFYKQTQKNICFFYVLCYNI